MVAVDIHGDEREQIGNRIRVGSERRGLLRELAGPVALEEDRLAIGGKPDNIRAAIEIEIAPRRGAKRGRIGRTRREPRRDVGAGIVSLAHEQSRRAFGFDEHEVRLVVAIGIENESAAPVPGRASSRSRRDGNASIGR